MNEEWKDIIIENCDKYQVSNLGNIRRKEYITYKSDGTQQTFKEKLCSLHTTSCGYLFVNLQIAKNKKKAFSVHRLVATYFIPNPENKPEVNHIDGNKKNNVVTNLEWTTRQENELHAFREGLAKHTEESKAKISKSLTGIKRSDETKKRMSEAQKKRFKK